MDDLTDVEELFKRWRAASPVWPPVGHEEIMQLMEERMQRIVLSQPFHGLDFPWAPVEHQDQIPEGNSPSTFNPDDYLHLYVKQEEGDDDQGGADDDRNESPDN